MLSPIEKRPTGAFFNSPLAEHPTAGEFRTPGRAAGTLSLDPASFLKKAWQKLFPRPFLYHTDILTLGKQLKKISIVCIIAAPQNSQLSERLS